MSNESANCPRPKSQKYPQGSPYNTSGRPLTIDSFKACPRNSDESFQDLTSDITESDFSESNKSNSITPPVLRGRQFDLKLEMQRSGNRVWQNLLNETASASSNRPISPQRIPKTSQLRGQMLPTAVSRGHDFNSNKDFQSHQTKSNTCSPHNSRNVRSGQPLDLDRLYDYNTQAYTTSGPAGRSLDVQRDLPYRGSNLPTSKGQRATSCPTPMEYTSTGSKTLHRQAQTSPQRFSSACLRSLNSTSPANVSRTPVTWAGPYQRAQGSPPRGITKNVTTTITRTTSPSHSPSKSPQTRSSTRSPVRSPGRSQRQDNKTHSSVNDDISELMDHRQKQTPRRGFATPPAYRTPPHSTNITPTQLTPDNSNISNMPQTLAGNSIFAVPLSQSTLRHDAMDLLTLPRPDTITDETILSALATPSNSFQMQEVLKEIDESFRQIPPRGFATAAANKTPAQPSNTNTHLVSPSFQRPENSNLAQRPLSEASNQYESTNIQTAHRPNTMINENTSAQVYNSSLLRNPSPCKTRRQMECPAPTFKDQSAQSSYQNQTNLRRCRSPTRYEYDILDRIGRQSPIRTPCPKQHQTRYANEVMVLSGSKSPTRAACPIDNSSIPYRQVPQEVRACDKYEDFETHQDINSTAILGANLCREEDMLATRFDNQTLPSTQKPFRPMEAREKTTTTPDASLFKSVANKLSATYDFLTSFVAAPQTTKTLTLQPESSQYRSGRCFDATDLSASLQECANAKRCGRAQFGSSDKYRAPDPNCSGLRQLQIEHLVDDTYCPGIIQETVDGHKDFNAHSFNITLQRTDTSICNGPPEEEPMTLLEAFSIRIERERSEIEKQLSEDVAEEQIKEAIETHFSKQNSSDLNRSIESLLLSENIQKHDKVERTKENSFEADVQRLITNCPDNFKIKVYFYAGRTKPVAEEPST